MIESKFGNAKFKLPRLIRHDKSGVWIGYVYDRGVLDPENAIMFYGRRIWSWSGGRLECSQLATQGVRTGDEIGDLVEVEIPIAPGSGQVEAIRMKPETVEACLQF